MTLVIIDWLHNKFLPVSKSLKQSKTIYEILLRQCGLFHQLNGVTLHINDLTIGDLIGD